MSSISFNPLPYRLIDSWDYSAPVANIDFINLGSITDLQFIATDVTTSSPTFLAFRVSVDNGLSFYTSADYRQINSLNIPSNINEARATNAGATGARSPVLEINGLGNFPLLMNCTNVTNLFVGTTDRVNAIRFYGNASTITGGSIKLYGR